MPRPPRLDPPGARQHVYNRGARKEHVFLDDRCCAYFLSLVAQLPGRFGIVVHGYALMGNHYHLLLEDPHGNLALAMQFLASQYARYLNDRFEWDGPVWKGRYRNRLVESEAYWRHLLAYVHLNPVRAHIVSSPEKALWTSCAAYLGLVGRPDWLTCAPFLMLFGGRECLWRYTEGVQRKAVRPPEGFDPEDLWTQGRSETLPAVEPREPAARTHREPDQALAEVSEVTGHSVAELGARRTGRRAHRAGWLAAWWLAEACGLKQVEIGALLDVGKSAVSKRLANLRQARGRDPVIDAWVAELRAGVQT